MLKNYKSKKILSLLLVCIILTTLIQVVYADGGIINITKQPTETLTADFGESPGTISVVGTASDGKEIKYQWYTEYEDGSSSDDPRDSESSYTIPSNYSPGTYKFYCELTADGCDTVRSEMTVLTVNKIAYTGPQADTVYVKANTETTDNIYILPDLPMSDMKYSIDIIEGTLVKSGELKFDSGKWKFTFDTNSVVGDRTGVIKLKIIGDELYADSIFTLTVKAGKEPVDIIGIVGTNDEYSGTSHKGYSGEPKTGGYKGELKHHYKGRNGTDYDRAIAPTGVGDYTVTVSIPEDADYIGSKDIEFSIIKRTITVQPIDYTILEGDQLTSDILINYFNFLPGDDFSNSILTPAVAKFTVNDGSILGNSPIVFEKEATLKPEKEGIYVLNHVNGTLEIQKKAPPSVTTYTVTVNGSYDSTTGAGNYFKGETVNIYAGSRSNYSFNGWTSSDAITFANANSATTSFTMPDKPITVTANWTYIGGGGSGSGDSSSYKYFDITAKADEGGSITPSGSISVREGKNEKFTIKADIGYIISDVLVDGKSVGAVDTYTFKDISKAHTIRAKFSEEEKAEEPIVEEKENSFIDVNKNDWFAEDIMWVYENGLMNGTTVNTFSPNGVTTRGMIVTILHRLEGSPLVNISIFSDVNADKYYANAVAWASENKIVNGYGNDKFGPEDAITREQLAVILMNYARYKAYDISAKVDLSKFDDAANVSGWALDAIAWVNAKGLIQGDGNNLMPRGNATRAQVAAILHRFVERIVK